MSRPYLNYVLIEGSDAEGKVASPEAICVCSYVAIVFARLIQGEQTVVWMTGVFNGFP